MYGLCVCLLAVYFVHAPVSSVKYDDSHHAGVHPTLGSLATSQAFFYALSFSTSDGVPPPAPARVTRTVRRLILKSHMEVANE
jgi:hypothetical protein